MNLLGQSRDGEMNVLGQSRDGEMSVYLIYFTFPRPPPPRDTMK